MPDASNDTGGTTAPPKPVLELGERRIRIVSNPFLVHMVLSMCRLLVCGVPSIWGWFDVVHYFWYGLGPQRKTILGIRL